MGDRGVNEREQADRALMKQLGFTAIVCVPITGILAGAISQIEQTFKIHVVLHSLSATVMICGLLSLAAYMIMYKFQLVDPSKDTWKIRIWTMAFHLAMVSSPILTFTALFIPYSRMWIMLSILGYVCGLGLFYSIIKNKL